MTEILYRHFNERLEKAVKLIDSYPIAYEEMGLFGSFARGRFNNRSDIDICLIVKEHPKRDISGDMRSEAEEMGVDIVYATREYFNNSDSPFAQNLRRDYQLIKHGGNYGE